MNDFPIGYKNTTCMDTENEELMNNYRTGMDLNKKAEYIKEFKSSVDITRLIGDYSVHRLILVFLVAAAVILIIVLTSDTPKNYWYAIYSLLTVGAFLVFGFIGFKIKKKSRVIKLELFIDFILYSLTKWTIKKVKEVRSENDKRIIIENLISSFYDYTKFKNVRLWYKNLNLHDLYRLVDSPDNQQSLNFSINLFDSVFTKADGTYNEKGVLVVVKIFLPILNVSNNSSICSRSLTLIRKFMIDTQMDVFKSRVVNKRTFTRHEDTMVTKNFLKNSTLLTYLITYGSATMYSRIHRDSLPR